MARIKKEEPSVVEKIQTIKEELAALKKKKRLTQEEKERKQWLEAPPIVIRDKAPIKKSKKKTASKKPKEAPKRLENGEFIATPTTLTKLKSYITKYVKAMGWKKKDYAFPQNRNIHITNLKIDANKDTNEVTLSCRIIFQTKDIMCSKDAKKVFTLENHKEIIPYIKYTYRAVIDNVLFNGDKLTKSREWMVDNGWGFVY